MCHRRKLNCERNSLWNWATAANNIPYYSIRCPPFFCSWLTLSHQFVFHMEKFATAYTFMTQLKIILSQIRSIHVEHKYSIKQHYCGVDNDPKNESNTLTQVGTPKCPDPSCWHPSTCWKRRELSAYPKLASDWALSKKKTKLPKDNWRSTSRVIHCWTKDVGWKNNITNLQVNTLGHFAEWIKQSESYSNDWTLLAFIKLVQPWKKHSPKRWAGVHGWEGCPRHCEP